MFNVPVCTIIVDTYPRPLSNAASTTVPDALRFGLALRSHTSASNNTFSNHSSLPTSYLADISYD